MSGSLTCQIGGRITSGMGRYALGIAMSQKETSNLLQAEYRGVSRREQ